MDPRIIEWLLDGDPSIRFLTHRDLLHTPESELAELQEKIALEGWGRKFLDRQDARGTWGNGLYGPKWISTHYTLMTLMDLGLSPNNHKARSGCQLLLDKGHYKDGGINHFASLNHSETCVTGMTLSLLSYFQIDDPRVSTLKDFLLQQQMADGGWNCESFNGAIHSSFHTTISALEALERYNQRTRGSIEEIKLAQSRAHEFLLCHHLFKSDKTAKIVDMKMTRFSFPPRWKYDVLRGLDYFQGVKAPHDPRFCDAISLLKKKQKDGRWPLQQKYSGRIFFDMEKTGMPSRMNTLRAYRILNWWNGKVRPGC